MHKLGMFPLTGSVKPDTATAVDAMLADRADLLQAVWHPQARTGTHYFAIPEDAARAAALHAFLAQERPDILWSARGGYGCVRLLPHLDFAALPDGLTLAGYSDITALFIAAHVCRRNEPGLPRLRLVHGPMPIDIEGKPEAEQAARQATLRRMVDTLAGHRGFGREPSDPGGMRSERPGTAAGPLLIVNLTMLTSLVGTPWLPACPEVLDGVVLVIEDVDEEPYRIDRMLRQLRHAGMLDCLAALVVGSMDRLTDSHEVPAFRLGPLLRAAVPGKFPIVTGYPVGHGPVNVPHRLGDVVAVTAGHGAARVEMLMAEDGVS